MRLNVLRSDANDIMKEVKRLQNLVMHKSIPGCYYEETVRLAKEINECNKLIENNLKKYNEIMSVIYDIQKEYKTKM